MFCAHNNEMTIYPAIRVDSQDELLDQDTIDKYSVTFFYTMFLVSVAQPFSLLKYTQSVRGGILHVY